MFKERQWVLLKCVFSRLNPDAKYLVSAVDDAMSAAVTQDMNNCILVSYKKVTSNVASYLLCTVTITSQILKQIVTLTSCLSKVNMPSIAWHAALP